jgi:hypothetical protein
MCAYNTASPIELWEAHVLERLESVLAVVIFGVHSRLDAYNASLQDSNSFADAVNGNCTSC